MIYDILLFFLLTIPCVYLLTIHQISTLYLFIIIIIKLIFSKKIYIIKTWINWFEISKLIGVFVGIFIIIYCRYYKIYLYFITYIILSINIWMAVLSDFVNFRFFNGISGVILFLKIPKNNKITNIINTELFIFPLSIYWIICYTSWNAAFSYGFSYSLSTRLILFTSIIVSIFILDDLNSWLGCRTYGLLLNMIFRIFKVTYLYKPNQSLITRSNNIQNYYITQIWGVINLIIIYKLLI